MDNWDNIYIKLMVDYQIKY